jgi:hypothetical protein
LYGAACDSRDGTPGDVNATAIRHGLVTADIAPSDYRAGIRYIDTTTLIGGIVVSDIAPRNLRVGTIQSNSASNIRVRATRLIITDSAMSDYRIGVGTDYTAQTEDIISGVTNGTVSKVTTVGSILEAHCVPAIGGIRGEEVDGVCWSTHRLQEAIYGERISFLKFHHHTRLDSQ